MCVSFQGRIQEVSHQFWRPGGKLKNGALTTTPVVNLVPLKFSSMDPLRALLLVLNGAPVDLSFSFFLPFFPSFPSFFFPFPFLSLLLFFGAPLVTGGGGRGP